MPPRRGKKSKKTVFIDVKKSKPEQWEEIRYHRPKKLEEPCARNQSDGEWFPIERILDTIYIVGTNKMWQHLVQWKPSWSRQVTASALRDFHAKVTVLGCVVKDEVLRSRARQKIEWNRREFMCSDFAVRITDPDGTSNVEVMPYPDVKRRFPYALFEFLEDKMPMPRQKAEDEPRSDGLLSVYDDINIAECLKRDPNAPKVMKNASGDQTVKGESEETLTASSACAAVRMDKKMRRRKDRKYFKGVGYRRVKRKSCVAKVNEHGEADASDGAAAELRDRTSHLEISEPSTDKSIVSASRSRKCSKILLPPGVSPSSAKQFLDELQSAGGENKSSTNTPSQNRVTLSISIESPNKVDLRISKNEDDDVVIIYDNHEAQSGKNTAVVVKSASPAKTHTADSAETTKELRVTKKTSEEFKTADGETAGSKIYVDGKRVSPRLSTGSASGKRNIQHGMYHRKRNAPLRSRNSLENFFGQSQHKQHRLSGDENGPKVNGFRFAVSEAPDLIFVGAEVAKLIIGNSLQGYLYLRTHRLSELNFTLYVEEN